jgi:hypothetical protein
MGLLAHRSLAGSPGDPLGNPSMGMTNVASEPVKKSGNSVVGEVRNYQ